MSSARKHEEQPNFEPENLITREIESTDCWEHAERERDIRQGFDLATTLERIEKNFVITDPRLPDNPIVRCLLYLFFHFSIHNTFLLCTMQNYALNDKTQQISTSRQFPVPV